MGWGTVIMGLFKTYKPGKCCYTLQLSGWLPIAAALDSRGYREVLKPVYLLGLSSIL